MAHVVALVAVRFRVVGVLLLTSVIQVGVDWDSESDLRAALLPAHPPGSGHDASLDVPSSEVGPPWADLPSSAGGVSEEELSEAAMTLQAGQFFVSEHAAGVGALDFQISHTLGCDAVPSALSSISAGSLASLDI